MKTGINSIQERTNRINKILEIINNEGIIELEDLRAKASYKTGVRIDKVNEYLKILENNKLIEYFRKDQDSTMWIKSKILIETRPNEMKNELITEIKTIIEDKPNDAEKK